MLKWRWLISCYKQRSFSIQDINVNFVGSCISLSILFIFLFNFLSNIALQLTLQETPFHVIFATNNCSLQNLFWKSCLENWMTFSSVTILCIVSARCSCSLWMGTFVQRQDNLYDVLVKTVAFNQHFNRTEETPGVAMETLDETFQTIEISFIMSEGIPQESNSDGVAEKHSNHQQK